jgi:hypothetical protein
MPQRKSPSPYLAQQPRSRSRKQFYASIELDPILEKKQFADLVDEVILQRTSRPGVKVRIAVEFKPKLRPVLMTTYSAQYANTARRCTLKTRSLRVKAIDEWQGKNAHLAELLNYARLRPLAEASLHTKLI